jgi:hypothetical protein
MELPPESQEKHESATQAAQKAAHFSAEGHFADADLAQMIDAWPTLPDAIKTGILAMVRAARG